MAEDLGLASHYQANTPILPPTLVGVPPSNYTFLSTGLRGNDQVQGSVEVTDGHEISFYVMNEGNFSQWRAGRPSVITLVKPTAISYNFTFTPNLGGTYYFVFDNPHTSRRVVIFSLNAVEDVTVLSPIVQFAGYEMFVVGIILSVLGIKAGRKPKPIVVKVARWNCKFCGKENKREPTFCEKCGRSHR